MKTLGDFSRLNARRLPDKAAVRLDEEVVTFRQLDEASNRLGFALASAGVAIGDRVALLAFNCPEYAVVSQAVAKVGGILVPISTRLLSHEVRDLLAHCEAKVLVVEAELVELARGAIGALPEAPRLVVMRGACPDAVALDAFVAGQPSLPLGLAVDPAAPAAIMYTSGTTGAPKGVLISHEKYLSIFLAVVIEMDVDDRDVLQVAVPLFHNGGFATVLNPGLMIGATSVCYRGSFKPDKVLADVERYGITTAHWVPTMLSMLLPVAEEGRHDLSSLRKIQYGGMPITTELLQTARRVFKAEFYQGYGTTDAGMIACLRPEHFADKSHMTGRVVFNTASRIVDARGDEVAVGEVGEVVVDAETSGMMGYWRDEEATRQVIRAGWIHTGDMARREPDGFLTVVDRKNFMIISGAENIFPTEVELVVAAHPDVREVAVFGIPDPRYGEVVCAAVVPRCGELDADSVKAFCEGRIARYKIPRHVFVLDALPRTAIGKIAKGELRRRFSQ